jgi:adenylate cyclase
MYLCFVGSLIVPLFSNNIYQKFENISLDILTFINNKKDLNFNKESSVVSPVVVIAIDEHTYQSKPFKDTPKVLWTSELSEVIRGVEGAGAKVVGLDVIFPTSANSKIKGFDRPFLSVLKNYRDTSKLVLAKAQHGAGPVLPHIAQRFALRYPEHVRSVNLYTDSHGIARGVPAYLETEQTNKVVQYETTFSSEIAKRFLGRDVYPVSRDLLPRIFGASLDGVQNILVNFNRKQSEFATYSLSDIFNCYTQKNSDFLEAAFKNKVVLIGSVLDVEDRRLATNRFSPVSDLSAYRGGCALQGLSYVGVSDVSRASVPGVYIHAQAIDNFINQTWISTLDRKISVIIIMVCLFSLYCVYRIRNVWVICGAVLIFFGVVIFGSYFLFSNFILPPIGAILALSVFPIMLVIYEKYSGSQEARKRLTSLFGLYVSPSVIDEMVEEGFNPHLGGETRELSIYFSDIKGFTNISEGLSPERLVGFLNTYLSTMTDIIERNNGFVDKYIGDAIVAVFGAPLRDDDHASSAVKAALECERALERLRADDFAFGGHEIFQRIGINTGDILIGNIGSEKRFNYTVIGDAVNLAARLEALNKIYGTSILISEGTAEKLGSEIACREIDQVRVVGKNEAVRLYEPYLDNKFADVDQIYAEGLKAYYEGRFHEAICVWEPAKHVDNVINAMVIRARELQDNPPASWDGIYRFDAK